MNNQKSEGKIITLAAAPYAVASGGGVLMGALFGIATSAIASGAEGEIKREGMFEHAKNSAEAWTQGAKVYWDNTNKVFTTTSSGNTLVGCAGAVAANPSATGIVILDGTIR